MRTSGDRKGLEEQTYEAGEQQTKQGGSPGTPSAPLNAAPASTALRRLRVQAEVSCQIKCPFNIYSAPTVCQAFY